MAPNWHRLIRFVAEEDGQTHLGEIDHKQYPDVGLARLNTEKLKARLVTGSVFDGVVTDRVLHVAHVRSAIVLDYGADTTNNYGSSFFRRLESKMYRLYDVLDSITVTTRKKPTCLSPMCRFSL